MTMDVDILIDPDRSGKRLAELRQRRWLLAALIDDIEQAWRALAPAEIDAGWRSPAQRGYLERRRDLVGLLRRACLDLDEALESVNVSITELKAAG